MVSTLREAMGEVDDVPMKTVRCTRCPRDFKIAAVNKTGICPGCGFYHQPIEVEIQGNLFEVDPAARQRLRDDLEKFLKQHGVKSYTIEDRNGHLEVRLWWK